MSLQGKVSLFFLTIFVDKILQPAIGKFMVLVYRDVS